MLGKLKMKKQKSILNRQDKKRTILGYSAVGIAGHSNMTSQDLVDFLISILASSTEYSIVAKDLDNIILAWNEGARRLYGYEPDEILGKSAFILHDPVDVQTGKVETILKEVNTTGKWTGELVRIKKNKEKFLDLITYSLRKDKNNNPVGYTVISRDITSQKRLEKKLIKHNQDLEQFTYLASHDLKTPLRGIESLAKWIEEDNADILKEGSKKHLKLLRQRVTRIIDMIDGILHYARIGLENVEITKIETKSLLKEIIESLHPPDTFTFEYSDNLPVFYGPKLPLTQVLSNLISNSIKHHHSKIGKIKISVHEEGNHYCFSVADDGPGIEPEYHEKIFRMFEKLESSDSTGIGLSIVKKIVEQYGGRVTVESEKGKGAIFRFTWPIFKKGDEYDNKSYSL